MNRFCRRSTTAALVLVAIGCSKGETPATDSAKTLTSSRAAGSAPAPMPGALTKPIDQYTGDEFLAFVHALQYTGGNQRQRNCKNDPGCGGTKPSKHTDVLVDAVGQQDSISAATTPKFGVVYIRAINKGDAEEARYGLKPGPNLEYYSIILPDSAGGMKWQLELLDTQAKQHAPAGTGTFRPCDHSWVKGAKADFKTCAKAAKAGRDTVLKLGLSLQGVDDDPMWAACASGCCVEDK